MTYRGELIPDDGLPIIMDSSAIICIMASEMQPPREGIIDRTIVVGKVKDEVDEELQNIEGLAPEKFDYKRYVKDVKPDKKCLDYMEEIHKHALNNPKGKKALDWIKIKRRSLTNNHELPPYEEMDDEQKQKALGHLYEEAEPDRMIMAQAVAAAPDGGYFVTNDGDFHAFAEEITQLTAGKIKIYRPEILMWEGYIRYAKELEEFQKTEEYKQMPYRDHKLNLR